MNYAEEMEILLEILKDNYMTWSQRAKINSLAPPDFLVESGNTYDKIIKVDKSSRSVIGFIVKKATKKFIVGDILKANSYKAPATNFARGNLFAGYDSYKMQWCGIS